MKEKVFSILTCLLLLASFSLWHNSTHAATYSNKFSNTAQNAPAVLSSIDVTTTADSGAGSLREAITTANTSAGTTIKFNIPTSDPGFNGKVFTIPLESQLPAINMDVTIIDGSTQTVATGDTNPSGPEVVIDGSLAPIKTAGFILNTNSNQIRNLVISNFFGGNGIVISGPVKSNLIANCYIGTDETGTLSAGNLTGIRIEGGATINTIGGSATDGNLISGNNAEGLVITDSGTDGNIVTGNFIGVDVTTNHNQLPNLTDGIVISNGAKANVIGGTTAPSRNTISGNLRNGILVTGTGTSGNIIQGNFIGTIAASSARGNGQSGIAITNGADSTMIGGDNGGNSIAFNASNGVSVGSSTETAVVRNTISRNSIFSNGGLGIDLGSDGVTKNDNTVSGPNGSIKYPEITNVSALNGRVSIEGTLNIPSPEMATVELFASTVPSPGQDPSGFGEGQTFMISATPDATGQFTAVVVSPANISVTATATDKLGNTSEFSPIFQLGGGQPDFIVNNLTSSLASVTAGNTVSLQFSIRNQGASTASSAQHNIVLSTNNTLDGQDLVLGSVTTSVLAPNSSQTFQFDAKIPADGPSGALFIGVIADANSAITESVETNNTANTALAVTLLPDLTVKNLTVSKTTINPGENLRIEFGVLNQGSSNTGAHVQDIRLSTDNIINANDTLLTSLSSNGINAGATTQFVADVQIPANVAPGQYFIGVVTDGQQSIAENDETNNVATAAISVSGSVDFSISELTLTPSSGVAGSQIALNFKLNNLGSNPAPASSVEVRLSNNATIDGNDTLLGTIPSSALAAGGSATLSFTGQLPAVLSAGPVFIGVIADSNAAVAESNENNNSASAVFIINDQNAPAVMVQSPNGNETITSGAPVTISWTSTDDVSVTTQDIFLSTDGGNNFNQVITSGLPGTANTFVWNVPAELNTGTARIQVVARDAQGNVGRDSSDANFAIGLRPTLTNPVFNLGKLKFTASGSNIQTGATLIIVNGSNRETFNVEMSANGQKFVVKKDELSSPSGLTLNKALPRGTAVQLIVHNPNGIESAPITYQR